MNIATLILSVIITICLYNYFKNKNTTENFTDVTITENAKSVINKHEVDYSDKIYDNKFLMDYKAKNMKTKNKVSFWKPYLDSGIYSIGSAVGKGFDDRPKKLYSAVSGVELRNPVDYELVHGLGRSGRGIEQEINDLNLNITSVKKDIDKYETLIKNYNNSDPLVHVAQIWDSEKSKHITLRYPVPKKDYWVSNRNLWKSYGKEWNRFQNKDMVKHLDTLIIPYHMNIRIIHPKYINNKLTITYSIVSGARGNPSVKKNVLGKKGINEVKINLKDELKTDMRNDIVFSDCKKNPKVLSEWEKILSKLSLELPVMEKKVEDLTRELNEGMFAIWKPVPPNGYKSIGDLITRTANKPMLSEIKCIPERCTREVRAWEVKDRVMVYEEEGKRISLYRNPVTMTLFTTREVRANNKWVEEKGMGLKDMSILRIYPCLEKCNYVDSLVEANKCARNMCSNHKKDLAKVPLIPRKADALEEKILLSEIKEQDEYLENLKTTIAKMEKDYDKFNIVHKEYNRHEFAKYLTDQEKLHKGTINKLIKSRNGVAVNINSPGGVDFLKKLLMDYLKKQAKDLTNKNINQDSGIIELPPGCTNWTEFKKTHRCKYSNPPCFGCINPT